MKKALIAMVALVVLAVAGVFGYFYVQDRRVEAFVTAPFGTPDTRTVEIPPGTPAPQRAGKFPVLHHVRELPEQIVRIVGPGRRLGMVLHGKQRQGTVPQPFIRVIIQIHVSCFDFARRQRIRIHAKVPLTLKLESIAGLLVWLVSDAARDVNGAAIPIYGRA